MGVRVDLRVENDLHSDDIDVDILTDIAVRASPKVRRAPVRPSYETLAPVCKHDAGSVLSKVPQRPGTCMAVLPHSGQSGAPPGGGGVFRAGVRVLSVGDELVRNDGGEGGGEGGGGEEVVEEDSLTCG